MSDDPTSLAALRRATLYHKGERKKHCALSRSTMRHMHLNPEKSTYGNSLVARRPEDRVESHVAYGQLRTRVEADMGRIFAL
jgi:hypothetical protein